MKIRSRVDSLASNHTSIAASLLAAAVLLIPAVVAAQVNPVCPLPGQTGSCGTAVNSFVPVAPLDPLLQPKFVQELPVPVDFTPDTTSFPGFDYYEIAMKPVTQVGVAFPQSPGLPPGTVGRQWTGLCAPGAFDPVTNVCATPLYTPVWGYGQVNQGGGPLAGAATWPAMSFRAQKGRPVKVKWINQAPDQHLFCPNPTDSDVPCAIDRTLMGTKVDVNGNRLFEAGEVVNPFGGPQQPDNAMVVHLHGGEIPPDSDGFAELWIGNQNTSKLYNPGPALAPGTVCDVPTAAGTFACGQFNIGSYTVSDTGGALLTGTSSNIDPKFHPAPGAAIPTDLAYATIQPDVTTTLATGPFSTYASGQLVRPKDDFIFYNYPMVQEPATIWYHDHALGKTRVNVAAGPAGFFLVEDAAIESGMYLRGELPPRGDCSVTGVLGGVCYDLPIALQDRSFNADGSINFPNGLGQTMPVGWVGPWNPLTPSAIPTIHPQWVPEYFGDMPVVNGVIWPKKTVEARPYRMRLLGGSNARCWTLRLSAAAPPGAKKLKSTLNPSFVVVGTEQGYVPAPIVTPTIDICPGERYDVVVDFSGFLPGTQVFMNNTAGAPYPNGITPQSPGSPFAAMAQVMRFDVGAAPVPAVVWAPPATLSGGQSFNAPLVGTPGLPVVAREMVLNEVLDPLGFPVRVQIDGKAFEAPITETPRRGSVEAWTFINTTVDAHPIHLHLVKFKVVSRQPFNARRFGTAVGLANLTVAGGALTPTLVAPFLMGMRRGPDPYELGWKDTVRALPGEVTTVIAKWDGAWADQPSTDPATGAPLPYWEAVTSGPYVWHCHIVDHEDNEMMRPSLVLP